MLTRLLLAVLILTNPICCQMFGSVGAVRSGEPIAECDECACECDSCGPSQEKEDERVPHAPCESPNCELCQCVCAGAIVTGIVTAETSDCHAPVDAIVDRGVDGTFCAACPVCFCDAQMACCAANVGRTARILHASLLC